MNEIVREVIITIIGTVFITGIGWYLWHNKYFMKVIEKLEERLKTNYKEEQQKLSKEHDNLSKEHDNLSKECQALSVGQKELSMGHKDLSKEHDEIKGDIQRVYDKIPDNHYFDYIEDVLKPFSKVNVEKIVDIRDIQLMTNQLTTTYATVYEKQNSMDMQIKTLNAQVSNYQNQVQDLELTLTEHKQLTISLQEELQLKDEQIKNYNLEINSLKEEIENLNNPKQTKGMKM